jgi:hypothetical protein
VTADCVNGEKGGNKGVFLYLSTFSAILPIIVRVLALSAARLKSFS